MLEQNKQQPAAAQEAVAYLDIGAGGYIDLGSDLSDEQLLALPKGRHALAIIGTFGIDGYVAAPVAAAPATYFPLTLRGLIAYGQVAADPSQRAVPNHMRYLIEQMVPHLKRLDEIESNTPAAPGIDHAIFARDIHHAIADAGLAPMSPADNYTLREVIRSVIDASPKGGSEAAKDGEVLVTVCGLTGSGKSAVAGEIEILCKALGLEVEWADSEEEKRLTHADWTEALELYKPRVRIVEVNIPRAQAGDAEVQP